MKFKKRRCKYEKCNKFFIPKHAQQEYCSEKCWLKAHNIKRVK